MKYILLIGDGMGDVPVDSLGGKTPLEAAATPTLDRLAPASELLLTHTVPAGFPPGSDVANLSLLGYEPQEVYSGRAPLEAASMGVELGPNDIAFRCNLVHVEKKASGELIMADYSAGHITTVEARELIQALQANCGNRHITLYPGVSYRHLLVLHGPLPPSFTTVPPHDHSGQNVAPFFSNYKEIEPLAQLYACGPDVLTKHQINKQRAANGKTKANFFWLWGEGKRPSMSTIREHYGLSGGMISAVDLLKGIGVLSGLKVIDVPGATGYLDTNYAGKAQAALDVLAADDFVAVHVEAPDECGHQGLLTEKMRAISDFDAYIVRPIVEEMERRQEPFRLVVTMDHYTPLHLRTHVDWPVPMLLYDTRSRSTGGLLYSEANTRLTVEHNGRSFASGRAFFQYFVEHKAREQAQHRPD
ncbi:MAG: cofactor-independent phosphoglycerate mutase [Desulfobulbaceae bacterium]|nr:cofactor-independent phosphoglycerate mutase [Desulfobulbaceae bacterium]